MSMEDQESGPIHAVVKDYIEGWYLGDVDRMNSCLHQDMVKRSARTDEYGNAVLRDLIKGDMVSATRDGGGSDIPQDPIRCDIQITDRYEEMASVTVESYEYIDFLHLLKQDGVWRIVNVVWSEKPTD